MARAFVVQSESEVLSQLIWVILSTIGLLLCIPGVEFFFLIPMDKTRILANLAERQAEAVSVRVLWFATPKFRWFGGRMHEVRYRLATGDEEVAKCQTRSGGGVIWLEGHFETLGNRA